MGNKCCGKNDERGFNSKPIMRKDKGPSVEMGRLNNDQNFYRRRKTFAPNMKNFKNLK